MQIQQQVLGKLNPIAIYFHVKFVTCTMHTSANNTNTVHVGGLLWLTEVLEIKGPTVLSGEVHQHEMRWLCTQELTQRLLLSSIKEVNVECCSLDSSIANLNLNESLHA